MDATGNPLRMHPSRCPKGVAHAVDIPRAEVPAAVIEKARRHWLEAASWEHASIASFLRCADELAALGAPDELIEATRDAARDEGCHTAMSLAVASALADTQSGTYVLETPPAITPRTVTLESLSRAVFEEGCVGETAAALEALKSERAARRSGQDMVADVLAHIAEDESEHAALAWRTLSWLTSRGGQSVCAEISRAVAKMDREMMATVHPRGFELDASALGCPTHQAQSENAALAWTELSRPFALKLLEDWEASRASTSAKEHRAS